MNADEIKALTDPNQLAKLASELLGELAISWESKADYNLEGVSAVAWNPNTPSHALAKIAEQLTNHTAYGYEVRGIAENPSTSGETLAKIASSRSTDIRASVAWNPNTPPSTLAELAADQSRAVRRYVADNKAAPADLLAKLSQDSDTWVCKLASNNMDARSITLKKESQADAHGAAANAACIAMQMDDEVPYGLDVINVVAAASVALSKIESQPGFEWESAPTDWESTCFALAQEISRFPINQHEGTWEEYLGGLLLPSAKQKP